MSYMDTIHIIPNFTTGKQKIRLIWNILSQSWKTSLYFGIYLEYFESILENLSVFRDFDVYGHIDYVVRYGPNKNKNYSYHKFQDVIDEILRTLITMGKGIEINMAGFKYGLSHPNPTEEILKRYRQMGGETLTTGADAHLPEHVAYDYNRLKDLLLAAGFSYYTVFEKRKAKFYPL